MAAFFLSVAATGAAVAACTVTPRTEDPVRVSESPAAPREPWAAPYYHLGASGPPVTQVMRATGIRRLTLAFIQSDGGCDPAWQGRDPLTARPAQDAIRGIRAAGGDVAVSFGGQGGTKLGVTCPTPAALAAVYQKVIGAYQLRAIDVDIEDTEISEAAVRQRVVSALIILRRGDPKLMISVTIAAEPTGPGDAGRDLIMRAAASGLRVDAWTIMPFDFSADPIDMGRASVQAAEALKSDLMTAYHESASAAYQTMGISSMNGRTDTGEVVRVTDFQAMLEYAQARHLARFTFWSVNRDIPCAPRSTPDSCSGIDQAPYAFTRIIASYGG